MLKRYNKIVCPSQPPVESLEDFHFGLTIYMKVIFELFAKKKKRFEYNKTEIKMHVLTILHWLESTLLRWQ